MGRWQDTRQSDAGATPVLQGRVLDFGGSPSLDADRVFSHGAAAAELQANDSTAQQDRIAEIEAQIERLTAVRMLISWQMVDSLGMCNCPDEAHPCMGF